LVEAIWDELRFEIIPNVAKPEPPTATNNNNNNGGNDNTGGESVNNNNQQNNQPQEDKTKEVNESSKKQIELATKGIWLKSQHVFCHSFRKFVKKTPFVSLGLTQWIFEDNDHVPAVLQMMRLMYARFVNTNFSPHLILEEEDFKQVKKREPKGDEELKWLRYKRLMLQTMKVKTFQLKTSTRT
jgi:hypothetical protein